MLDFGGDDRCEARCKGCGYTWYEIPVVYFHKSHIRMLYGEKFEKRLRCKQWNCRGEVTVALSNEAETEGFQGGLTNETRRLIVEPHNTRQITHKFQLRHIEVFICFQI